jgi:hypothetical protein
LKRGGTGANQYGSRPADRRVSSDAEAGGAFKVGVRTVRRAKRIRRRSRKRIEALSESARLLHWGGQLVLETGIAAPVEEIVARLRAVGFIGIDVARLGLLRFTAVLGGP